MNLRELWEWEKRKLGCRIRVESGNPAYDEIREELSRMTGVEVPGQGGKRVDAGPSVRQKLSSSKSARVTPERSISGKCGVGDVNTIGTPAFRPMASAHSLLAYQQNCADRETQIMSKTRKNIYKKFFNIPRGPPTKVMLDLQRDKLRSAIPEAYVLLDELKRSPESHDFGNSKKLTLQTQRPKSHHGRRSPHEGQRDDNPRLQSIVDQNADGVDRSKSPFKDYRGDLFSTRGEYMGGVIYKSRLDISNVTPGKGMQKLLSPSPKRSASKGSFRGARSELSSTLRTTADGSHVKGNNSNTGDNVLIADSQPASEDPTAVEAKLHCANSIATWSVHRENVSRLAEEGAVSAAIVLSKDENADIRRSCAIAFRNMSQHSKLCEQLIKLSAVPVISELGVAAKDMAVSRDCSYALVNLTNVHGMEPELVEDGIVIALMSLMNQHEELADTCSRGLFNLTCVDGPYQYMERVMKAFISLATSTMASVKHICAAALCNLSDIKPVRSRIVEEGVVQVIGVLSRGAEARTRRVCAIILHLLASTRICRPDMVSKGAVQVLYSLSSDIDTITLHYIASAIIKLSMEEPNLPRLVHEGGVTALCNICLRCPHDAATTQLCASALSLLSQQVIGRQAIVQEGCVPAIVTLLNEASDTSTIRNGLSAFTNLLMDESNHAQVLSQGGIAAVISLCRHSSSEIREACALAMFNFSRGEASRDESVSASAVPAIIALCRLPEPRTRMRCAATLCKFASVEQNVALMVEADVVPAFIDMLQTRDKEIVKHCCAALCRLAHEGSSAVMIAKGAVPHVIAGCGVGSDAATRQSCCAVLSAVSAHEPCRQPLCAMGALHALITLARDRSADDATRLRCAVAFANLSNEPAVQAEMVDAGIVPVIADLSNSYCEENQLYCARALCNLASHPGCEEAIVEQGGVAALMMISMVRAVSHFTKQVCAKAISNLITTPEVRRNWLPKLAKDGLVQAVSVLSRLSEEDTMKTCANIFCSLSAEGAVGRMLLVERCSTLSDVFALMRSKEQMTQIVCGKTACNLLGYRETQGQAVAAGAVKVLSNMCTLDDPTAEEAAAAAFFLISGEEICRTEMLDAKVLPVLIAAAQSSNASTCDSCLRVIAHLSWWKPMRIPLLEAKVVPMLVKMVTSSASVLGNEVLTLALHVFTYMTFVDVEYQASLVRDNVVVALRHIYYQLASTSSGLCAPLARSFVATALRSLTEAEASLDKIVGDGAIRLLCDIVCTKDTLVFEHCATAICEIARKQCYGDVLLKEGVLDALPHFAANSACFALAAATLHVLSLESSHREAMIFDSDVRGMLMYIAEAGSDSSSAVRSCAQTFYWLSRCTGDARQELVSAGLVPLLIRLSRHESPKVAASCSEALKNLSSGSSGGIEEGTVSTLIAMTLNGGQRAECAELEQSTLVDVPTSTIIEEKYAPTVELMPQRALESFVAYEIPTVKLVGGTAGAGPPPPEPPEMNVQDTITVVQIDNTDAADEEDSSAVASMMFAKLSVEPAPA